MVLFFFFVTAIKPAELLVQHSALPGVSPVSKPFLYHLYDSKDAVVLGPEQQKRASVLIQTCSFIALRQASSTRGTLSRRQVFMEAMGSNCHNRQTLPGKNGEFFF